MCSIKILRLKSIIAEDELNEHHYNSDNAASSEISSSGVESFMLNQGPNIYCLVIS